MSPWGPTTSVTSLSVVLAVILIAVVLIFRMVLTVDQYFVSLSMSEATFQTLSIGADISRLALIASKEEADAWGTCPTEVTTTEAIATATTAIAVSVFLVVYFFMFLILFIME